ncbi:hypothetical protein [Nocardioides caricicola]|uniref:Secreted protein n=1 Tax=Nocardioides caricicola TaxID=634770 RepID=A0ABW0MWB0_9ACTN
MGTRRTLGWVAVAALLAAGTATATTTSAVSAPGASAQVVKGAPGAWDVRQVGVGQYVVSWTSPTRFPLTSDRPTIVGPSGIVVGAPTIAADGRTVRADVASATRPDPADFDVVLSGDRLDAPGDDRLRTGTAPERAFDLPGTVTLPDDPGTPGPFDTETSDYTLPPVQIEGMPEPIEMVGHVVEPAAGSATGPRPLVLFLHGRHSVCYDPDDENGGDGTWPCEAPQLEIPSQLGYDYVQRVLASQGYATVSVRVNGINAQDYRLADGGADARAEIVEQHLDHWTTLAAEHQLDLDRVVLVGHSRGGEGVDRAALQIPLSAPYRIAGQVLIAPTNFGVQTAAYVPTVTLLPYCDGDVSDLQGQKFTDVARDLVAGDTSLKSSVLVMGANHNYFNTEWTPDIAQAPAWDDWGGEETSTCHPDHADRLSPEEQQAVGTAYVAGAVHLFADDEQDLLPLFDGSRARVDSIGDAQALSHAIGGGRDVRAPGVSAARSLPDGASTRFCSSSVAPNKVASCANGVDYGWVWPHWVDAWDSAPTRTFFEMRWTAPGQSGGLLLDDPIDLSSDRLELRTIVDPENGPVELDVRITDENGDSAVLGALGDVLPALAGAADTAKYWAQTLYVDPAAATGVDLAHVVQVDLVPVTAQGRVWVADLAAAPAELAPVPDRRLATIDLHSVTIDEGDGNGNEPVTAAVPFDVVGELTEPATVIVMTTGQGRGDKQRFTLDLAPGQTSGSIPVSYLPDDRDDYPRAQTQVAAWAIHDVMTDQYAAQLTVKDDDPTPRMTVEAVDKRVREGGFAEWKITLARGIDYDLFMVGKVVRGPGNDLTAGDVGEEWLERYLGPDTDPDKKLWTYHAMVYEQLRAGNRSMVIKVPIRRDDRTEGRESLTLKFRQFGNTYTRTVFVERSR